MRRVKLAVLFVLRALGMFRVAAWITRRRLKILCYHGFALDDETGFRSQLFITPDTFASRLETLQRMGMQVLSLSEAVDRLYNDTLPERAVVITIDDGFFSVYEAAAPLLRRHRMPATVYVTTYYVDHPNPVFRLAVQYMFWKSRRDTLTVTGVPWADETTIDLTDRVRREQWMWEVIHRGERECTEDERVSICRQLGDLLEVSYDDLRDRRLLSLMTPDELCRLRQMDVDVQLHTHRHRFPDDDEAAAEREILENRAALNRILGPGNYNHFCYPSGEWRENQWKWLDRFGIRSSTTCASGMNTKEVPRQALRRFLDGEKVHAIEFEAVASGLLT